MKTPQHLRILYAEDSEDAGFVMTTVLHFSDIEVVAVRTIADAWQRAQAESFDLYLLDSRFPDGDGFDLCRRLHEYAPNTPIVIYSDDALESDVRDGLCAGAQTYLIKPYFNNIAQTIFDIIEQNKKRVVRSMKSMGDYPFILQERIDEKIYSEILPWNPQI